MKMAKNTESELSNGQTSRFILESFIITTSTVKAYTPGPIIENTKENGETTKCMGKVLSYGQMVANTLVSTLTIRKKAMVSSSGLMVGVIEVNGTTANSMVKEPISLVLDKKSMENGMKANASDGLGGVNNKNNDKIFYR